MKGYARDPHTAALLIEALRAAIYAHPNQRLGQLLKNVSRGKDIWNIWDEEWVRLLNEYVEGL